MSISCLNCECLLPLGLCSANTTKTLSLDTDEPSTFSFVCASEVLLKPRSYAKAEVPTGPLLSSGSLVSPSSAGCWIHPEPPLDVVTSKDQVVLFSM